MGCSFAVALLKKTATLEYCDAFGEAMERLGYRRAFSAEASALSFRMCYESRWLSLSLEIPQQLDKELDFLRTLAAEMHTTILYFFNYDSDFLYIAATDGKDLQHVHVGSICIDEVMQDSEELSVFDRLLPDDAARSEFRRILAMNDREFICSEYSMQDIAVLFDCTPEILFFNEDVTYEEFGFYSPDEEDWSILIPMDSPPAFTIDCESLDSWNPIAIQLIPRGGCGKGVRVLMKAEGYDAEDWEASFAMLSNQLNMNKGLHAPLDYTVKKIPKRITFPDGSKGWQVEFSYAPVFRGVNPDSPMVHSKRAAGICNANGYTLYLAFNGGTFKDVFSEKTHIWVIPMENPAGLSHYSFPRQCLQSIPKWVDTYEITMN